MAQGSDTRGAADRPGRPATAAARTRSNHQAPTSRPNEPVEAPSVHGHGTMKHDGLDQWAPGSRDDQRSACRWGAVHDPARIKERPCHQVPRFKFRPTNAKNHPDHGCQQARPSPLSPMKGKDRTITKKADGNWFRTSIPADARLNPRSKHLPPPT